MRQCPRSSRCRTADSVLVRLSTRTASTSSPSAGRSTQTTLVPSAICVARNRWLPATGTTISPSTRRAQNAATTSCSRRGSSLVRLVLNGAGEGGVERIRDVVHKQPDRAGTGSLAAQVAGEIVALVAKL